MRGGAKVLFGLEWKVDNKKIKDEDLIDHIKRLGLGEEDEEEVISEITDEVENHVEKKGYKSAKVPLRSGVPSTLGSITAKFNGAGEMPSVSKFEHTVTISTGKRITVSADFHRYVEKTPEQMEEARRAMEEFMKTRPGAKGGKHTRRH